MTPKALPRHGLAPVAVSIRSRIEPVGANELPQLTQIAIALNRHGRIDWRSRPVCRLGHIEPSTTVEARSACGSSLVGEGTFSANVKIPEQSPFPSKGRVLAFNGRLRGKPALFAHIYGTAPVPTSYVLPFAIKRIGGSYGTLLEADLPRVTGEWGYVTGISLDLNDPAASGYLSAGCPAPSGVDAVPFPLAKVALSFVGGVRNSTVLTRVCRARR